MAQPSLLATAVQLGSALDALATLAAHLRVETERLPVDDRLRVLFQDAGRQIAGVAELDASAPQVIGLVRAFLRQATDLVENPGRLGDWDHTDPTLLQGIGRLSGAIAGAFREAEAQVPGLGERLSAPAASILDVGTGTGWLAIALARTYPQARIVGLDIFDVPLTLARANVASEGLASRIELRAQDVVDLPSEATFDVIWLPLPFLPQAIVPRAVAACAAALKPGGWLLPGTFAGPGDELSRTLNELRIVRSGGHPWTDDELHSMLHDAGLDTVTTFRRTWDAPVHLVGARKP